MAHKANWKLPPFENTLYWWAIHDRWRRAYNTCGECGSTKLILKEHDLIWHDGKLFCEHGHFVPHWDAG